MDIGDLWRLDATAQAALVRERQLAPRDLVDAAIARIERLNLSINAVIAKLYDRALSRSTDASLGGPFAGVPLLLKDAGLEVEGTPYCIGLRPLRDIGYRSQRTTELARRFEAAGFIFMGKTNVPELSSGITTEATAFGPARNPWDTSRTTSGSSGGSAAAVAAGMTSIAHGGDGTGSLRYPAAVCGVVTLKPSRGRMPPCTPAGMPDPGALWSEFVLARSVRDLAGVLDAVGGAPPGALHVAPPPSRPYVEEIAAPPPRLRIGLLKRDVMAGYPTDPDCVAGVERAGKLLADLGHDVTESHPPALDGLFARTFADIVTVGIPLRYTQYRWLAGVLGRKVTQDDFDGPMVTADQVDAISASRFLDALTNSERDMREITTWWTVGASAAAPGDDAHDILITPTVRQPAWPLGQNGDAADSGVFTPPFSFTGQPAMSVPLHHTDAGLPVGVQLVAAHGREDLLLSLAAQMEAADPWASRWPALATAT